VETEREPAKVVNIEQFRRRADRDRRPLLELLDGPRPMLRSPFRALTDRQAEHRARMLAHMRTRLS
jgi:hypothetical protein